VFAAVFERDLQQQQQQNTYKKKSILNHYYSQHAGASKLTRLFTLYFGSK
jgi:hypothetical protein